MSYSFNLLCDFKRLICDIRFRSYRSPVISVFTQGQIILNLSDSWTSIAHKRRMRTDFINLRPDDLLSCLMLRYWEGQIWSCWKCRSFCVGFGLWLRGREPSSDWLVSRWRGEVLSSTTWHHLIRLIFDHIGFIFARLCRNDVIIAILLSMMF